MKSMKFFSFMPKLYVYQKIILVFAALIVPLYLIHLWFTVNSLSFTEEQFTNSAISNAQYYARQLNEEMTFVRNLQLQFVNDTDLQKLSFKSKMLEGYEEVRLINSVWERLAFIQRSSAYLENAGVYVESLDKTISTRNGITRLPNQEYTMIASAVKDGFGSGLYQSGDRLLMVAASNGGSIVSYLELSADRLKAALSPLAAYTDGSGAALTARESGIAISPNPDDAMIKQLIDGEPAERNQQTGSYMFDAGGQKYRITYNWISALGMTLYTYTNHNELTEPMEKFTAWVTLLSVISGVIALVFAFSVNRMIHKPLKKLIISFKTVEADQLSPTERSDQDNEFTYLYRGFDRMVERLEQSIQQNYEQRLALQQSEFKQLQSQINPHFLYNNFFNLYMMCKAGDFDNVSMLARKLGGYYQFITRSGADEVPLHIEYRHAMDYVEIQKIRFSNRIDIVTDDVPEEYKLLSVPRLIVQPVIENAFEHAFENSRIGGTIWVAVRCTDGFIAVVVEDDGSHLSDDALLSLRNRLDNLTIVEEKTGLLNVSRRLKLKYGDHGGIYVSRSSRGGLRAEIRIPCRTMQGGSRHV